ncbi:MAG: hypothetical protein Q9195_003079 [Heterodermia aff. obscurata]
MRTQQFFCLATLFAVLGFAWASSLCYYPDGTDSDDIPCHPTADVSFCCARASACLSNLVCENPPNRASGFTGDYARGSCTDKSWNSTACPQFCQTEVPNEGCPMTSCMPDGDWCCTVTGANCCGDTGNLLKLGNAMPVTILAVATTSRTASGQSGASSSDLHETATSIEKTQLSISPSSTIATVSSPAAAAPSSDLHETATSIEKTQPSISPSSIIATASSSAATAPTSTHSANDTAIKVGTGVGIPLGLLLVGTLAYIAFLQRKRTRDKSDDIQRQGVDEDSKGSSEPPEPPTRAVSGHEVHGPIRYERSELPGEREPAELRGHGRFQLSDVVAK